MATRSEIEAAKSPAGGWTKAQLAAWGVPWPPPKGWRKKLEAGEIKAPFKMSQAPEEVTAAMDRLREVAFDICQEAIDTGTETHQNAIDVFTLINEINDFRKAASQ